MQNLLNLLCNASATVLCYIGAVSVQHYPITGAAFMFLALAVVAKLSNIFEE